MNMTDSDEKLLHRAAEIVLKDIGKVEGIEINPLNPENISTTAVEELILQTLKCFLNPLKQKLNWTEMYFSNQAHVQDSCLNYTFMAWYVNIYCTSIIYQTHEYIIYDMVRSVRVTLTVTNWRTVIALVWIIPVSNYYKNFFLKRMIKS